MGHDWTFVWTPQFWLGTLVAGLLLNILGAYVVRAFDRVRIRVPAYFRRVQGKERERIQQLSLAATADNALYAALAAEAGRLRVHQLLGFFIAFVCILPLLLLAGFGPMIPGAEMAVAVRVEAGLLIIFLVSMSVYHYSLALESGRRARRLDMALRVVQSNRALPIVD